jgi:hypothetical protein
MGLFNLGRRNPEKDTLRLMPFLEEALSEGDRVYRGQLQRWSELSGIPVTVSGLGLFKARVIAGSFVGYAFADVWMEKSEDEFATFVNMLSGAAWAPFSEDNRYPPLERSQAKAVMLPTMMECFSAIRIEFASPKSGIIPTSPGFRRLIELQNGAFGESISSLSEPSVANLALNQWATTNVLSNLHLCVHCIGVLRKVRF